MPCCKRLNLQPGYQWLATTKTISCSCELKLRLFNTAAWTGTDSLIQGGRMPCCKRLNLQPGISGLQAARQAARPSPAVVR